MSLPLFFFCPCSPLPRSSASSSPCKTQGILRGGLAALSRINHRCVRMEYLRGVHRTSPSLPPPISFPLVSRFCFLPSLPLFLSPGACSDGARRYTCWARVLVVAQIMWMSVAQTAMALPSHRSVGMSTSLREEGESRLVGATSAGEARLLVVVRGTSAAELALFLANIALALVDIHVQPASYACALAFPSSLSLFPSFPSPPFRYSRAYGLILPPRSASGLKTVAGRRRTSGGLEVRILPSFPRSVMRMPSGVVCDERQFAYDGSSHI